MIYQLFIRNCNSSPFWWEYKHFKILYRSFYRNCLVISSMDSFFARFFPLFFRFELCLSCNFCFFVLLDFPKWRTTRTGCVRPGAGEFSFFFVLFFFFFFLPFYRVFFFLDDDGAGQDAPVTGAPELNEAEPKATAAGPPQSNCPAL